MDAFCGIKQQHVNGPLSSVAQKTHKIQFRPRLSPDPTGELPLFTQMTPYLVGASCPSARTPLPGLTPPCLLALTTFCHPCLDVSSSWCSQSDLALGVAPVQCGMRMQI